MNSENYTFKQLDKNSAPAITQLYVSVFTKAPWNDNWSDKKQLDFYIDELIGQNNSLTFGLYKEDELIGISMGHIRHWHSGTEYYIDEFCILTAMQGKGLGTRLIGEIEKACSGLGITNIFILTENHMPAYDFYKKRNFHECRSISAFTKKL